jgi:hypothetical protein
MMLFMGEWHIVTMRILAKISPPTFTAIGGLLAVGSVDSLLCTAWPYFYTMKSRGPLGEMSKMAIRNRAEIFSFV